MARYFFHTQTDTRFTDPIGTELATPLEARSQAIRTVGEIMRDTAGQFWGSRPWEVTVTNSQGLILWEIMLDGVSSAAAPAG